MRCARQLVADNPQLGHLLEVRDLSGLHPELQVGAREEREEAAGPFNLRATTRRIATVCTTVDPVIRLVHSSQ